ncbi:ATP/GTP-binding protein [Streptomyces sp. NPDC059218]|uniref:ATP/GTP-binding protein n=1 Tax=unclassified Streptomyces TaxID=2593676 RepID=UPI0036AD951A
MLTARRTAAVATLALLLAVPAQSAVADGPGGGVQCPPKELDCEITAEDPGKPAGEPGKPMPGKPPGRPGKPGCAIDGKPVPCSTAELGTFNTADACYWLPRQPPPGPDDPVWRIATGTPADWKPGDPGKIYDVSCPGAGRELMGGATFSKTGPAGGGVDVQALAQQAVKKLRLDGPAVASPRTAGTYVVGMPMWMWVTKSPSTFGSTSASASAGGVTVTATAHVSTIRWDMGDGTTVTCNGPGTPYTPDQGKTLSPDCGHRYERSAADQPDGRYKGSATATWAVEWAATGGAATGDLTLTRQTAFTVRVGEVQVLN